jgi:flagellar biosynthesis chaperone FliJ
MEDKIHQLRKICQVTIHQGSELKANMIKTKIKLDLSIQKHKFLGDCLQDYRIQALKLGQNTIYSHQYQRYQQFFGELIAAVDQQKKIVDEDQQEYHKSAEDYELCQQKIKKLEEMLAKEINAVLYRRSCKENQELIDLHYQLKQIISSD